MSRQTAAVLWRTLVIQCLRRHYIESAVEVLVVLLLAIAFLSSNFATRPNPEYRRHEKAPRAPKSALGSDRSSGKVQYGISDDDSDYAAGDDYESNDDDYDSESGDDVVHHPDIKAFYSPQTAYAARLIAAAFPDKKAVAFSDETSMVKACESVELELCVHFRGHANDSDLNEMNVLSYTLHFFEVNLGTRHLDIGFQQPKEFFYEPDLDRPLWGYTYSAQVAINTAHITLQAGNGGDEDNITMKAFPKPKFPEDIERYRIGVFWLTAIVFLYPMWRLVARLTMENTQGLREYERLMGLYDCFYWTGQFACSLCFCLVYSAICVYCAAIQKQTTRHVAFLERTDLSLLYVVFVIHSMLQILLTMFVTCLFTSEFAALVWVALLCVAVPYFVLSKLGGMGSLAEFVFRDRFWTLLSSLLPTVASYNQLTIIGIQNDFDGGASWSKVGDLALGVVTFTMLDIWTVNLVTACILIFLIFYLTKVLPWNTAIPFHPLFLFNPHYWRPDPAAREPATIPLRFKDQRFESAPSGLRPVLHVEGLSVSYGNVEALKHISLQAFEMQCTVLVGRNGAGKTTLINVMAGLQKPSEGKVYICGYDVVRHTSLARTSMTYCPQRDMIFPDLTVWEHLLYIGTVQQIPTGQLKAAAKKTLAMVALESNVQTLSQDLKRGEMKRLSIAMAIIAKPMVVLIDEPTSGLDAPNTHSVWDTLLRTRGGSTLFVSTHDMTEADVLADRVVALTAGMVVCNASPNYLKSHYGVGYKVRLVKRGTFQRERVLSIIRKYVPDAAMSSETPSQATVALHTVMSGGFDRMFRELERSSAQLGIRSIGLGVSTLKDIYIKLTLASLSLIKSPLATEQQLPADLAMVLSSRGQLKPSLYAVFEVIMTQRILFLLRRWLSLLLGLALPVLIFLAAFHWMSAAVREYEPAPAGVMRLPVSLRIYYPSAAGFMDADAKARKGIAPFYHSLLQEEGAIVAVYNGTARKALLAYAEENYVAYTQHYVLGAVFRGEELEAWFNPYAIFSKILAYDLASSALLAYRTEDSKARFQTTVAVHIPESVRSGPGFIAKTESSQENPLGSLHELVHDMAHVWAALAPMALAMAVSAFLPFAIGESCSGFMELQLMTGIQGWLHCLLNTAFDAILFVWMILFVGLVFKPYYPLESASYDALIAHCASFGALAIASAYLIAYWSSAADSAYVATLLVFGIGGGLIMETSVVLLSEGQDPSFMCTVLPPCSVPMAMLKVIVLEWVHHTCDHMAATPLENSTALSAYCKESADLLGNFQVELFGGLLKAPIDICCASLHPMYQVDWSPLQLSAAGTGLELRFAIFYALLEFVLICCYRSGRFLSASDVGPPAEQRPLDTEVGREARKVHVACETNTLQDHALVVEDVHKWYEDDYCVCGFNLALSRDECFGLLGVHGCGKTAVAEILAGLALPSLGECHMDDTKLSDSARDSLISYLPEPPFFEPLLGAAHFIRWMATTARSLARWPQWQSQVGYCPEEDALMDVFSANEILYFFARLRGVPDEKLNSLVKSIANVIDIGKQASEPCGTYSGTRRKLSVAVAIIGSPRVVILDDATSGVDMVGRQMVYDTLRDMTRTATSAVILTSRSTEECEVVCSRVGFMACGELKALDTVERLKDKFLKGSTLTFALREKITPYIVESVNKAVTHVFPGAKQADCREGVFLYFIPYKLPWSHVFSRIGKLRNWFRLESLLVAESTLDELFLGMARAEMAEDAAIAKRAAKDASYAEFPGDPWGREAQAKHQQRQQVRERRRKHEKTALKPAPVSPTKSYQSVS